MILFILQLWLIGKNYLKWIKRKESRTTSIDCTTLSNVTRKYCYNIFSFRFFNFLARIRIQQSMQEISEVSSIWGSSWPLYSIAKQLSNLFSYLIWQENICDLITDQITFIILIIWHLCVAEAYFMQLFNYIFDARFVHQSR